MKERSCPIRTLASVVIALDKRRTPISTICIGERCAWWVDVYGVDPDCAITFFAKRTEDIFNDLH